MKIETAPFDRDLEVAVIEADGVMHVVVFPCRRVVGGWLKAGTARPVEIHPTHWREWGDEVAGSSLAPNGIC